MIIVMQHHASDAEISAVVDEIRKAGLQEHVSRGSELVIIGAIGDEDRINPGHFEIMAGVERVTRVTKQYKIVSRDSHPQGSVIKVRGIPIGGEQIQVISGPCSIETQDQMNISADAVAAAGCRMMRGGAFKPRTSPYAFQGLGIEGLEYFQQAAGRHNLPIVTELMDVRMLDTFMEYDVDVIQIGARNMQNFDLLKEVGRVNKPIILKRGLSATVNEWLMAAEYIAAGGNHNIIFCERGIRTFETAYRNVLDVTAIPVLKRETHLPVIVDPSHAGGKAWMVPALAQAAVAAGADGLLVEMHPNPCDAWCDADQALTPDELKALMVTLGAIANAVGRTI
ncbi:3-deoxy-7-phosphoheptulonate synthase [Jeongeupia wiesaeckerbachi]|uniref:3-deoxy-7-phosphoheptulonate synthase n=1 Tax=Jeongeupia wiesaeckerbachi TaxID=3051218 RepID=UPI003D800A2E